MPELCPGCSPIHPNRTAHPPRDGMTVHPTLLQTPFGIIHMGIPVSGMADDIDTAVIGGGKVF